MPGPPGDAGAWNWPVVWPGWAIAWSSRKSRGCAPDLSRAAVTSPSGYFGAASSRRRGRRSTGMMEQGGPAFVPKVCLNVEQGISLLQQAGGTVALAHPPRDLGFRRVARISRAEA